MGCDSVLLSVVLCYISIVNVCMIVGDQLYPIYGIVFFFQAEDGIRYLVRSRGLGDVYKRHI